MKSSAEARRSAKAETGSVVPANTCTRADARAETGRVADCTAGQFDRTRAHAVNGHDERSNKDQFDRAKEPSASDQFKVGPLAAC